MLEVVVDPLKEFMSVLSSPLTKRRYELRLEEFLKYARVEGDTLMAQARTFEQRAKKNKPWSDGVIDSYLQEHKVRVEKGEINASTISIYSKPIRLFCEVNEIPVNWFKISRKLPHGRHYAIDRAPSREEIRKLLDYPDRRIKPIVLTMVSSGIRIGAWETLDFGHIEPQYLKKGGPVVAAKMRVYAGDEEEYYTFISPEAYHAIEDYVAFRKDQGEEIHAKTPILRELFPPDRGSNRKESDPLHPRRLRVSGVKRVIEDGLLGSGVRKHLAEGKRRHEFQGAHGFRKFFKTTCEKSMKSLHVEILLGHDVGLSESYYRPKESELLNDYLKAVPDLTILENPSAETAGEIQEELKQLREFQVRMTRAIANLQERGLIPDDMN